MIDRRLLTHFDWFTASIAIMLAIIGLTSVYSATHAQTESIYTKEFYWIGFGIIALIVSVFINYSTLERYGHLVWGASVFLLIAVAILGKTTLGAKRWINLGVFSVQPSEIAKIALIIVLAKHYSEKPVARRGLTFRDLAVPAFFLMLPFLLIVKQPDLGTAIILWLIFWSITLIMKINRRTLIAIILIFAALMPVGWRVMKPYQKARVATFLNPEKDPLGTGYHVMQSKIAIGSGGLYGKGFTQGTQGKLMFLPEHHTDFIFAVYAEEWGLTGSLVLLGLFMMLILSALNAATNAKDRFGFLLAYGITAMIFWHVVINIGMVSGIMPVVGVPLPFISYGGSFMLTCMIATGLIINIKMRKFMF